MSADAARRPTPRWLTRPSRAALPIGAALVGALVAPGVASAHGPVPPEPPSVAGLLLGWTIEPLPALAILAAAAWWTWAVRRVNAVHPGNPVPRRRSVAFGLGLAAIAVALLSGIDRYDTTLFSIHMAQHVLLTLVAPPLLALGAPITLWLRVASPGTRRRWILPLLHARITRAITFPVVTWLLFAATMWLAHFSILFDAALEDPFVHELEHALFLGTALLFWWPAVAIDPSPWRMSHPARAAYVFLQMPQNTLLSVVILSAATALYPHYTTLDIPWGTDALVDQRIAAAIMWLVGDAIFLVATLAILWGWMRSEARDAARTDRRAAAEMAQIRVREARLAERLARERAELGPDASTQADPGTGGSR